MEGSEWIDIIDSSELEMFEDLKERFVSTNMKLALLRGGDLKKAKKTAYETFIMFRSQNTPYELKVLMEGIIRTMRNEIDDIQYSINERDRQRTGTSRTDQGKGVGVLYSIMALVATSMFCIKPVGGGIISELENEPNNRLGHTALSFLEELPLYSLEYSTLDGFLLLGPSMFNDNTFTVMTHGNIALKCLTLEGSAKAYTTGFKYHFISLNSDCDDDERKTVEYRSHGSDVHTEITLNPHELPSLSCDGKHLSHQTTYIMPYPPGQPIQMCVNGSYQIDWDIHNQSDNKSCDVFYWTKMTIPCSMSTGKKLLSLSCEVELKDNDETKLSDLLVSLHGSGEIRLLSDKFIKTEICNGQCTIPIGKVSFVHVTCPDGSEYKFNTQSSIMDNCLVTNVPVIRHLNIFLCKSSHHPYIMLLLIIWLFIGKVLIKVLLILILYLIDLLNKVVNKANVVLNPELACCEICGGKIFSDSHISSHSKCDDGICSYCDKKISKEYLMSHLDHCNYYSKYLINGTSENTLRGTSIGIFNAALKKFLFGSALIKLSNWVIILILFLWVLLPPVLSDSEISTNPYGDSHLDKLYKALENQNLVDDMRFTRPNYQMSIKQEAETCGINCMHMPYMCKCPSKELNDSTIVKINNRLTRYLVKEQIESNKVKGLKFSNNHEKEEYIERKIFSDMISNEKHRKGLKKKSKSNLSDISPSNDTFNLEEKVASPFDSDNWLHHMKTAKTGIPDQDKLLRLPHLTQLITSWGIIDINSHLKPGTNLQNLETDWVSTKIEGNKVFSKGTAIGKLEIFDNSGITWTITNKDSDEKKSISLYILESAQRYKLTLKYFTASRTLSKWYRGVCTGDCPDKCTCSTDTCKYKMWDYDRGWGCNPTWCWTVNGGCSCCAVDVVSGHKKWTLGVYDSEYQYTEIIFCLNEGHDKTNCYVSKENNNVKLGPYTITLSKAYGVDRKIKKRIGLLWMDDDYDHLQLTHPKYVIEDPEVCDTSCNHGEIGDYKAWDIYTASGVEGVKTFKLLSDIGIRRKVNTFSAKHNKIFTNGRTNVKTAEKIVASTTYKENMKIATETISTPLPKTIKLTTELPIETTIRNLQNNQTGDNNDNTTIASRKLLSININEASVRVQSSRKNKARKQVDNSNSKVYFGASSNTINPRKKRWSALDTDNEFDKHVLRSLNSNGNELLNSYIDKNGIVILIVKFKLDDSLHAISSNTDPSKFDLDELSFICDQWRYLQAFGYLNSKFLTKSVNFRFFVCRSIVDFPFNYELYLEKFLKRQAEIAQLSRSQDTAQVHSQGQVKVDDEKVEKQSRTEQQVSKIPTTKEPLRSTSSTTEQTSTTTRATTRKPKMQESPIERESNQASLTTWSPMTTSEVKSNRSEIRESRLIHNDESSRVPVTQHTTEIAIFDEDEGDYDVNEVSIDSPLNSHSKIDKEALTKSVEKSFLTKQSQSKEMDLSRRLTRIESEQNRLNLKLNRLTRLLEKVVTIIPSDYIEESERNNDGGSYNNYNKKRKQRISEGELPQIILTNYMEIFNRLDELYEITDSLLLLLVNNESDEQKRILDDTILKVSTGILLSERILVLLDSKLRNFNKDSLEFKSLTSPEASDQQFITDLNFLQNITYLLKPLNTGHHNAITNTIQERRRRSVSQMEYSGLRRGNIVVKIIKKLDNLSNRGDKLLAERMKRLKHLIASDILDYQPPNTSPVHFKNINSNSAGMGEIEEQLTAKIHFRKLLANSGIRKAEKLEKAEQKNGVEEMSWAGLDISHTCHTGSWPDCNYGNLVSNLDDKFVQFNKSSTHLITNYLIKQISVGDKGLSADINVLPRSGSGLIDFTIQCSGIEFKKREVKVSLNSIKLLDCSGCYGCNTGFKCSIKLSLSEPDSVTVHFESLNPFIIIDNGGYNLRKAADEQIIFLKGSSILKTTNASICIRESNPSLKNSLFDKQICIDIGVVLDEPEHKLIKREEVINAKSHGSDDKRCSSFKIFSCMIENAKDFFCNIWNWLVYGVGFIYYFIVVIIIIVVVWVVIKLGFKCVMTLKNRKNKKMISPKNIKIAMDKVRKFNSISGNELTFSMLEKVQ